MRTRTLMQIVPGMLPGLGLLLLPLAGGPAVADDDEALQGSVEVVYRNVSLDGSPEKYDEDFDALGSGLRLSALELDWDKVDSDLLDFARLDLSGLGGDPYERSALRLGRKDVYDLRLTHTKQDYLYNLFDLVGNEDGATWDAERTMTDVGLRLFPTERVELFFGFQDGRRTGSSLFMKDIERNLFRLETPLDVNQKRYTIGADFELGAVDVVFRQTLQRYDNQFDNSTEGDLGIEDGATLDHYDWRQNDSGGTDLTTLAIHADLGRRVDLTVSFFGTLLGDEERTSRVDLDAEGTSFDGSPYLVAGGTSDLSLEGDNTLVDAGLSVMLVDPLTLHVQFRTLDRELEGDLSRDLDGDGLEDDIDGDGVAGTQTRLDYELDTLTALLDYRPLREIGLRVGYRTIDRRLDRRGFGAISLRDTDLDSRDDDTVILGLTLRPVSWFRLNADREDGDVTQPFNAVAPEETEHLRVRAAFLPQDDMRIDLGYLDFEHTNAAPDLRAPGSNYDSMMEGTSHSLSFWHRANERVDYVLRYAEEEIESNVRVVFDQAGFFAVEPGMSIFDADNKQLAAQVNYSWADPWQLNLRYVKTESEGHNPLVGDASGLVNDEVLEQDYDDWEVGLTYSFPSGLFVGASFRDFEYDDGGRRIDGTGTVLFRNDGLDYEGQIFSLRAGMRF